MKITQVPVVTPGGFKPISITLTMESEKDVNMLGFLFSLTKDDIKKTNFESKWLKSWDDIGDGLPNAAYSEFTDIVETGK